MSVLSINITNWTPSACVCVCFNLRANKCNKSTTLKHPRQIPVVEETAVSAVTVTTALRIFCLSSHTFPLESDPSVTQTHSHRLTTPLQIHQSALVRLIEQREGHIHLSVFRKTPLESKVCLFLKDTTGAWGEERQAGVVSGQVCPQEHLVTDASWYERWESLPVFVMDPIDLTG